VIRLLRQTQSAGSASVCYERRFGPNSHFIATSLGRRVRLGTYSRSIIAPLGRKMRLGTYSLHNLHPTWSQGASWNTLIAQSPPHLVARSILKPTHCTISTPLSRKIHLGTHSLHNLHSTWSQDASWNILIAQSPPPWSQDAS
jgi:hypothetical protein